MKLFVTISLLLIIAICTMQANNLVVSEATLTGQNTNDKHVMVSFNISWQNSWRNSANLDGVWLFVKFQRTGSGEWNTAALSSSSYNHNTGTQGSNAIINPAPDGKGAFFYRATSGNGSLESNNVQLYWNYGENNIQDNIQNDVQKISIFGIEMCYVPQGAFYIGSGGSEGSHFYNYGSNAPYYIQSENEIQVGTSTGNLYYDNSSYGGDKGSPIPTTYPKGYNAYWCMKYEISQEQYVDFLNTLNRAAQGQRVTTDISGTSVTNRYVMSNSSVVSYRNGIACNAIIPAAPLPVTFYCDFNGNGVPNEIDDGQNIACNWLSWDDGVAYGVWSGLRPMTELEFEKACRGTATPVENEFAWGSTNITQVSGLIGSGYGYESVTSGNCNYNNTIGGPLRVGSFATGNNTREIAGASYYGIMELSGNLYERCISVGNADGRAYNPVIINQPSYTSSGFRGGYWSWGNGVCCVSDRWWAAYSDINRAYIYGFRLIAGNSATYPGILFTVTDIDGNQYPQVSIGTQIWSQKNLKVSRYRNGDIIPQVTDPVEWMNLTTGAWCYYNNDPANEAIYGKLYNWYAIVDPRGLAPEGCHIPSDAEWTILTTYLGGENVASGKLKEVGTNHWNFPNTGATNESGFTALPGGFRDHYLGAFYNLGIHGGFWSSTEFDPPDSWDRNLFYNETAVHRWSNYKGNGFSVRFIKD